MEADSSLVLRTSTDGTTVIDTHFTTLVGEGRQIFRITLDVNNGAAGRTGTLYSAPSMAGPWTQVQQIITAGTTSIYGGSAADLQLCNISTGSPIQGQSQLYGKMHGFQLLNGIAGTVVADLDVSNEDIGTTTWADAYGNTWNVTGTMRVGSDRIRHTGEMDDITYNSDSTRNDVWLPLKTLGALNRMQEAGAPVSSALFRVFNQYPAPAGYWPMEEGASATAASSVTSNPCYAYLTDCSFTGGVPAGLPGSNGSIRLNSSASKMVLGASGRDSTGEASIVFCFKLSSLPATAKDLVTITGNGTAREIVLGVGSNNFTLNGVNTGGVIAENNLFGTGANPTTSWVMYQITLTQEGANVRLTARWAGIGSSGWYTPVGGGETYPGTVGRFGIVRVDASTDAAFSGVEFAHVLNSTDVLSVNTSDLNFYSAALAWAGERAAARAVRVAAENGVDLEVYGNVEDSQLVGVQTADTTFNILNDAARVDSAILFDLRDRFAIGWRGRVDMENQTNNWLVYYEDSILSRVPAATESSRYTKNIMTISRPGGGSATAQLDEGPLSVQEPPDGIGPRPGTDSVNAYTDPQLRPLAEYAVWLRTRDELRIPSLSFEMHRVELEVTYPAVAERVIAAHLGSEIVLALMPHFVTFDSGLHLMVLGYQEQFNGHQWDITFNVVSADAFFVPVLDRSMPLADDGTTTLKAGITSTATSAVLVTPTTSRPWIYDTHPDWPGSTQVYIGGELCRITACAVPSVVGANYEQAITLARSTNGVIKAQVLGEVVEISVPYYLGLSA